MHTVNQKPGVEAPKPKHDKPVTPAGQAPVESAKKAEFEADKVAVEETPRIAEQKARIAEMMGQLAEDGKIAAIMFNPVFAPHANGIAAAAVARAVHRYETETPRQDFKDLYAEERENAREEILQLPERYKDGAITAGKAVGQGAVTAGAVAAGGAVAAYEWDKRMTAKAKAGIEEGVKDFQAWDKRLTDSIKDGVGAAIGSVFGGAARGLGGLLGGIGNALTGAGDNLQEVGADGKPEK